MLVYCFIAIVGATTNLAVIWGISETFNGLMVIPNLIALFLLSGKVKELAEDYLSRHKA